MKSNKQLLSITKDLIDTNVGGIIEPQDAQEFIDLAVDQTAVLNMIGVMTGIRGKQNLDTIEIGQPVIRKRVEGEDTKAEDISGVDSQRYQLDPQPFSAYFDVTFQWLRQNILGDLNKNNWGRAMQKLNDLFAKRIGKDAVLTLFNGDKDLTPATAGSPTAREKALSIFDGFITLALANANVHDYTIPATPTYIGGSGVFSNMIKKLPKDYRDRRDMLGFFVSNNVLDDYEDEILDRETAMGDAIIMGDSKTGMGRPYKRISVMPIFGMPDDTIILSMKKNLYAGWGVQMETFNQMKPRKKGGCIEVTINAELDAKFVVGDAMVLGQK